MDELERADIQGVLRHGYPYFEVAAFCFFEVDDPVGAGAWLATLLDPIVTEAWIDSADLTASRLRHDDCGVAVAFTAQGLSALGLNAAELRTFVAEFQEGMTAPHRSRLLGDVDASDPGNWIWNRHPPQPGDPVIGGVFIVYAHLGTINARVGEVLAIPGCPQVHYQLRATYLTNRLGISTEPFGFADGLSQPYIEGLTRKPVPAGVRPIKAGEFVLGYRNEIGRFPASPWVSHGPEGLLARQETTGHGDLGRNGTYLVIRHLEQNVGAFEAFVNQSANSLAAGRNLNARQLADLREWVGSRLVGRWKSGAPVVANPEADAPGMTQDELEAQDGFGYHALDRYGLRCPIGAHMRRANPRDSLAEGLGIEREKAQALVDQHRLLRRGRVYEENGNQGLMFVCLNANIERQFEFVQGTWLMHPEFGGLSNETDPLLGNAGAGRAFTVQRTVLSDRYAGFAQFVRMRGGGYFFLPGLRALRYLAWLTAG